MQWCRHLLCCKLQEKVPHVTAPSSIILLCLGPPQTRHLVVDNYLLSTTKWYRQLILSDASIPHIGMLVVDNLVRPARAWELTFPTHARNAVLFQNGVRSYHSCRQLMRPLHVKLMLTNAYWQIQIGVCKRHNNMLANFWRIVGENRDKLYFSPKICQHVVASFTHGNLILPTRFCQHKFDVWRLLKPIHSHTREKRSKT